jgi:hypothetical protein
MPWPCTRQTYYTEPIIHALGTSTLRRDLQIAPANRGLAPKPPRHWLGGRPRRRGGLTRLRLHCCLPARMATEQAARMAKQDRDQKRQQAKTIDYME